MDSNNRRVTKEQKFMLVQYLEEHTEFARDRFVNDTGAKSLQEQWSNLAVKLNALGGALKDGEGWKKAWSNMRSKAKQKGQDLRNALEQSGVNSSIADKRLTDLDERVIGVMTTAAVVGQTEVGEPLRRCGAVNSVELFPNAQEYCELEFLDESAGPSLVPSSENQNVSPPENEVVSPPENQENRLPTQTRAHKRKNYSLEEANTRMVNLEERRLVLAERKVASLEKRNCIEERKANAIEQNNVLLSNILNKLDIYLKK